MPSVAARLQIDGIVDEKEQPYGFVTVCVLKYGGIDFNGVTLMKTGCLHGQPGENDRLYEICPSGRKPAAW